MARYPLRLLFLLLLAPAAFVRSEPPTTDNPLRFFTEEYAPFSYSDNGNVSGINTELLKRAADQLELEVEFAVVPWGRAQLSARNNADACFFSAARTSRREDTYQWVGPLSREHIVLYSLHPDSPKLEDFQDASNYRVGGQSADAYSDWVEKQGVPVDPVTEVADNVAKLQWGRIELWLAGSIAGPYIATQQEVNIHPQATSDEAFELWLACNRDFPEALIQALNEAIEQLREDGTLDAIQSRYQ